MSRKQLIWQLVDNLRLDAELAGLVGHTSKDLRIGRDQPPIKEKTPYVGIRALAGIPVQGVYVTFLKTETIAIRIYSRDELKCIDIADRVEELFHDKDGGNVGYFDFSSSAADGVSVRQSRYVNRVEEEFDEDLDVWVSVVLVDVIWIPEPCNA